MIVGKTHKEQVIKLRRPQPWFAWYPVRLIDTRRAWMCRVWRWYDASYYELEGQAHVIRGRALYSRDRPSKRKPPIPTLHAPAYELFNPKEAAE